MSCNFITRDVVIASGAAVSASIDLATLTNVNLVGVIIPSAWTAADLKIQHSLDNSTWHDLMDAGADVQETVTASAQLVFDPAQTRGLVRYVRLYSVAAGGSVDVNQAAARTLTLILREVE